MKFNKKEKLLLKLIDQLAFLINNSAYMQTECLDMLIKTPMDNKYRLDGIFKYEKNSIDNIAELIKLLNK